VVSTAPPIELSGRSAKRYALFGNTEGVTVNKIQMLLVVAALSAAAVVAAAFVNASAAAPQKASKGTLVSVRKTALGKLLVDARGRTLYLFDKDKRGMSSCNGACAAYWPPVLTTAKPRAGAGVRASLLGVTKRADGRRQVKYAGHPLYTFIGDKKAGQTSGEGLTDFGAAWDAVAPNGRSIEPSDHASGSSGNGYGGGW
jgi:predicted lipoprotein with Yx(FWY)xxD motif